MIICTHLGDVYGLWLKLQIHWFHADSVVGLENQEAGCLFGRISYGGCYSGISDDWWVIVQDCCLHVMHADICLATGSYSQSIILFYSQGQ